MTRTPLATEARDVDSGRRSLAPFFEPKTVVVIGASRDPAKVGGSVLANLRSGGFEGRVIPVNARAAVVQGLRAVPRVADVNGVIDLAVLAVPAPEVLPALQDCAAHGVRAAVVISAGFKETDDAGLAREAELRAWLARQPMRVLGPNCLGWIRPASRLNATFAPGMPPRGSIAFLSHSGALAVAILDWSRGRSMGFSLFASLGNQADLTETDLIAAVAEDAETHVIVAYLEGVADGRRFVEVLRRTTETKPVIVLKAGRSPEGARAVSSHTGALAGSDEAFDAAVKQAGALRVRTIEELFDLARGIETQAPPRGRRLLVVTNGGGLGIVATDAARDAGLTIPPLERALRERLRPVVPAAASVANPIDLIGDADAARFSNTLHALTEAPAADAALVLLTAQAATDSTNVARAIVSATREWSIPVVTAFVGGARVNAGALALEEAGIPCYPFPERAVATVAGMVVLAERRRTRSNESAMIDVDPMRAEKARALLASLSVSLRRRLGLLELAPLLTTYGIPVAEPRLAATPDEAAGIAPSVGFPLAVKLVSSDITHKTEVGGVRLGLRSAEEVGDAAGSMLARVRAEHPQACIEGLLLQPMAPPGKELLLGAVRDPQFGMLVVVGFGGIYVEVLRDTSMRLAPVSFGEASAMLDELRLVPLLSGVRGEAPVDRRALEESIVRFSRLAADVPSLAELEINPLIAGPTGAIGVDARGVVSGAVSSRNPR